MAQGRKLLKVYYSTGRLRTIRRDRKRDPETMLLHVENIQARYLDLMNQEEKRP